MERMWWMLGVAAVFALTGWASHAMGAEADFPHLWLKNDVMKLKLYVPAGDKGYNQGARFDWSGMVARAEFAGHTFYGEWMKGSPTGHDHVTGTAGEFSMEDPLGFPEVTTGGEFYKIGIGALIQPEPPAKGKDGGKVEPAKYAFYFGYKIAKLGEWKTTSGATWAQFEQDFSGQRGWGWHYVKRIELAAKGASFTITQELKNTGTKPIDTTYYCHNFTIIDDQPIGPDYRLRLPFEPKVIEARDEPLRLDGRTILFPKALDEGKCAWVNFGGFAADAKDNEFTIENTKAGASVRVTGDRPMVKLAFWSTHLATCPEPFIAIKAAPGESMKWKSTYTLQTAQATPAGGKDESSR
jgi:hypothetical protein